MNLSVRIRHRVHRLAPWARFVEGTKAFKLLYGSITSDLRTFAAGLDAEEARWFNELIDEFDAAYRNWEYDERLRLCLERIDRASSQAFQVAAHAYIHIAYDLPRCIATCLAPARRPRGQGARDAYYRARDVLCDTFERACTEPKIFGRYAYVLQLWQILPFVKEFSFGIWASDLRERSFAIAEQLLISTDRSADEAVVWRDVERRVNEASRRSNPFAWLRILKPQELPSPRHRPDVLDVIEYVKEADVTYSTHPADSDGPEPPREGPTKRL
jgi:hypothetical protein